MRYWSRWNKIGLVLIVLASLLGLYAYTQLEVSAVPVLTRDDRIRAYTVYAVDTEQFTFKFQRNNAVVTKRDNLSQAQFSMQSLPAQTMEVLLTQYWNTGANADEYVAKDTCKYLYIYLSTALLKPSELGSPLPLEKLVCRAELLNGNSLEALPLNED